jgi:ketosteroid isomerase-like protein
MDDRSDAEAAIRRIYETVVQALHDKDVTALQANTASDVLTFDLEPPLQSRGLDPAGEQAWFDTWDGPIELEIRNLEITASDDVAFTTSLNRIGGVKADGGGRTEVWVRQTAGFVNRDGRWMMTHRHESAPFYMDGSVKAAIDLKPEGE